MMETNMRKPRDFDAELKALTDKAAALKARKVQQLGELVIATGADRLSVDELTGALVAIAATNEPHKREGWAKKGQAFFQGQSRTVDRGPQANTGGNQANPNNGEPR